MTRRAAHQPVTAARIERALALCAYLVARDDEGRVYAPIMDRLETEMMTARAAADPAVRARRLLNAYTAPTTAPALR